MGAAQAGDAVELVLEKKLPEVKFDDRPFDEVVESLRGMTGANLFVNWRALAAAGIERKATVAIHVRDVSVREALRLILDDVGGGTVRLAFKAGERVITISTVEDMQRETVTRVYDIRDLIVEIPDFGPPQTAAALAATATRPASHSAATLTHDDRVARVTSLVQETVDPESWRDAGGTVGAIRELGGQLIVTQTPENQEQVARVLETLREARGVQITVEARYLFVDQKTLDEMGTDWIGKSSSTQPAGAAGAHGTFLTDERVAEFLKAVRRASESTLVTAPRLTVFNGQRAWVAAKTATAYVRDYTVVRGKEGETRYEPVHATVEPGLTLDLRGTASPDRKHVTMTIRSAMTTLRGMRSRPFAGAAGVAPAGGVAGTLQVQEPDVATQTTETSVSVPAGETVLLVAMTPEAAEGQGGRPKGQTFILVKPTVIVQREIEAKK
jgi:hypothetical protein